MTDPQKILDNLRNAGLFVTTIIKDIQRDRDALVATADAERMNLFEAYVTEFRQAAEQLERELSYLEFLLPAQRE